MERQNGFNRNDLKSSVVSKTDPGFERAVRKAVVSAGRVGLGGRFGSFHRYSDCAGVTLMAFKMAKAREVIK